MTNIKKKDNVIKFYVVNHKWDNFLKALKADETELFSKESSP